VADLLNNPWISSFFSELGVALLVFVGGFLIGRYRERGRQQGRSLDDYDFYPYEPTPENFAEFNLRDFRLGIHYFLRNTDVRAARQLIFIGEQNNVRDLLDAQERPAYEKLFAKYHGAGVVDDTREFLENFRNLVRLIGRTFPNMGIEVLLHDLSNPSRSITAIESGEVTGRALEMGTTTLLIDLKKRRALNQDKLNYELNIGARRFKCTTIPIVRKDYGVIGAVCINIDINYIRDDVTQSAERIAEFFRCYARTDMQLEENILSKDEYQKALRGKKHYRDASY
jgi:predicted transcriptional regulator YheO